MAHRHFHWQLCVHERGQWRVWHSAEDYTPTGPTWTLVLRCALAAQEPACVEQSHYDAPRDAGDQWLERGSWVVPPAA
jgi:hypothetical protein